MDNAISCWLNEIPGESLLETKVQTNKKFNIVASKEISCEKQDLVKQITHSKLKSHFLWILLTPINSIFIASFKNIFSSELPSWKTTFYNRVADLIHVCRMRKLAQS